MYVKRQDRWDETSTDVVTTDGGICPFVAMTG